MKKYILLLSLSLTINCFSQSLEKPNCEIIKHSKLKYIGIADTTAFIVINNKDHIEYEQNKKYFIKSQLEWVNDCEYNATITEITSPNFPFAPGEVMNVKFDNIENDIISYTATVRGKSFKAKMKITK